MANTTPPVRTPESMHKSISSVYPLQSTPIYVLTTDAEGERFARFRKRMGYHQLIKNLIVWKATMLNDSSSLTAEYLDFVQGVEIPPPPSTCVSATAEAMEKKHKENQMYNAVFYDHLCCLRDFLTQTHKSVPGMIMMEDDVMMCNQFPKIYPGLMALRPEYAGLVLFSPFLSLKQLQELQEKPNTTKTPLGKEYIVPGTGNLMRMISNGVFSSAFYWVSRDMAQHIVTRYFHPLRTYPWSWMSGGRKSPEDYIVDSKGIFIWPPLGMEESCSTSLQVPASLANKRKYWRMFGLSNYQIPGEDMEAMWQQQNETNAKQELAQFLQEKDKIKLD